MPNLRKWPLTIPKVIGLFFGFFAVGLALQTSTGGGPGGGGGGGGTVTSVAGDGVVEAATPAITGSGALTLANAGAYDVLGNYTASSAAPTYGKVVLLALATQTADTFVGNASGTTASPTAVAMPTGCTTGVNYSTSTHTWTCPTPSAGNYLNLGSTVTWTGGGSLAGSYANGFFTVGTAGTTLNISSIPGTCKQLILQANGTNTSGSGVAQVLAQYNADTASDYYYVSVDSSGNSTGNGTLGLIGSMSEQAAPGSQNTIWINNPNGTVNGKTWTSKGGYFTASYHSYDTAGTWYGSPSPANVPITSILLQLNGGLLFSVGDTFSIDCTN